MAGSELMETTVLRSVCCAQHCSCASGHLAAESCARAPSGPRLQLSAEHGPDSKGNVEISGSSIRWFDEVEQTKIKAREGNREGRVHMLPLILFFYCFFLFFLLEEGI